MPKQIMDGTYRFKWLPTQLKVIQTIYSWSFDNTLFCGGFGAGKSRFLGELAYQISTDYPGTEFLFWRKTRAAIKATTYRIFIEQVIPPEHILEHNKSDLYIIDTNGSRYDFLGLDKITRKGSYWGDMALIDEAIELDEGEFRMVEGRLRAKHLPRPQSVGATNAGAPESFWFNEFANPKTRKPNNAYYNATSYENIHNPPNYFERLKAWIGSQYYDRWVLSLWKAFRGSIYETFEKDVHVVKPFEIPREWEKFVAVDFGFDHPLVMLWIAKHPAMNRFVIYRQFYKTHVLVRDAAKIGKTMTERAGEELVAIWADHDAENRAQFEEDWRETLPADKRVSPGIQAVQTTMLPLADGLPGFMIFDDSWIDKDGYWYGNLEIDLVLKEEKRPTCLQEEIPGYKWGRNDAPVKKDDDGCDGMRYGIFSFLTGERDNGGIQVIGSPRPSRQ